MLFLGLITADAALSHALGEQLRIAHPQMQHTVFAALDDALAVWAERLPPLLLWDADTAPAPNEASEAHFLSRLKEEKPEPLLLLLGDAPPAFADFSAAEKFTRPFRLGFFLSRLGACLRQLEAKTPDQTRLGAFVFEPRARRLTHAQTAAILKLTDKEAALLDHLVRSQEPASREELLAAVWGYGAGLETHTLETHLYRLRRKLMPPDYEGEDVFEALPRGYRLHPAWRTEGGA